MQMQMPFLNGPIPAIYVIVHVYIFLAKTTQIITQ